MELLKRAIIGAVILLLSFSALSCARKEVSPLHVEGTALLDEKGDTVVFRGVSFGWHNLWPRFYDASAVRYLSSNWKCNLFRFSIGVDDLMEKGEMRQGYLSDPSLAWKCVTTGVDAAISAGAYAIIDWHSHVMHTQEAIAFFDALSKLYKDCPNVIYELYNEPVGDSWSSLKEYADKLIKTIRANAPDALILMGCPHWDQDIDVVAADPIKNGGNLMYTVHFYAATHKEELREKTRRAIERKLPIFISECAAMEASGDGPIDYASWEQWLQFCDKNNLSMVMWSISDKDETCSMLYPSASSGGGWKEADMKEWGVYVSQMVRDYSGKK